VSDQQPSASNLLHPVIRDVLEKWQDKDHRDQAAEYGVDLPQMVADAVVKHQKEHTGTLGAWLYWRFHRKYEPAAPDWSSLPDEEKDYWEHEASAVQRAVARGGFKTDRIKRLESDSRMLGLLEAGGVDNWEGYGEAARAMEDDTEENVDHQPTLVHFGSRHSAPAEVCWGCSDEDTGKWVPVTQCPTAKARMNIQQSFSSSVVIPHPEGDGHG
jgi:hypothetical protein